MNTICYITWIHYITIHYMNTIHYNTILYHDTTTYHTHYITPHNITYHYIPLHTITLHNNIILYQAITLRCITLYIDVHGYIHWCKGYCIIFNWFVLGNLAKELEILKKSHLAPGSSHPSRSRHLKNTTSVLSGISKATPQKNPSSEHRHWASSFPSQAGSSFQ